MVAHLRPEVQVESAARTWPLDPTVSEAGVLAAVPAMMSPFAAITVGWITQAVFKAIVPVPVIVPPVRPVPAATDVTVPAHCVIVAHLRPEVQVESTVRT